MALYGAALSTVLAIAKAWSYFVGPRSIVQVRLSLGDVTTFDAAGRVLAKREAAYAVKVTNRSMHTVTVSGIELVPASGGDTRHWLLPSPAVGVTVPFDVAPRSYKAFQLAASALIEGKIDLRRVAVHLATGERVASNRVRKLPVVQK
jgi:hypothetical protein